ncbi:MAG: hypothetical protein CVV44_04295 [Spirochaetae bacterium HGW-Spirochaetae-1]|jgi:anti-anti-sigma factor|nr:MAG: hypothetical protein CVV44_04295 [Spirochaetae bacterium HGW-Spirochaetae-1]
MVREHIVSQGSNYNFYSYEIIDDILIISIELERLDMYNVHDVLNETDHNFKGTSFSHVIIEVKSLKYVDATAIGALMVAMGRMKKRKRGGDIFIVTERSSLLKIKELVKLDNHIFKSREEALLHIQKLNS